MESYIHPDYHLSTFGPSLQFSRPQQENQETLSPSSSTSSPHILLYYTTLHNVLSTFDISGFNRCRQTVVEARVYVDSESLYRDLVTVLLSWEVPGTYHASIVSAILERLLELIPSPDSEAPTPTLTRCLLRVDITFEKFYCTTPDPLQWWIDGDNGNNVQEEIEENDNNGMVAASEAAIKSLVVRKRKRDEIEEEEKGEESSNCPICLEEFSNGAEQGSLPCSHMFHQDCITTWLRTSHYCPICRFKMPTTH